MAEASRVGGTLLIAKLDRLSRKARFIFAQHEREAISKGTKNALAANKALGARLGTAANLTIAAVEKGREVRQANARTHQVNRQAVRLASLLQAQGHTLQQIAHELNESGYRTRRGKEFFPMAVQRLLQRVVA